METPLDGHFLRQLAAQLDAGEAGAIALAVERGSSLLLMDELDGRKVARRHGLPMTGTVGILLEGKLANVSHRRCVAELRLVEAWREAPRDLKHAPPWRRQVNRSWQPLNLPRLSTGLQLACARRRARRRHVVSCRFVVATLRAPYAREERAPPPGK